MSCGCLAKERSSISSLNRHKCNRSKYDLSGDYGIGYTYDGCEFYFDKEDYEIIKDYNWFRNDQFYFLARINIGNSKIKIIRLHRLIMNVNFDDQIEIDHIHGIKSRNDNRKSNLRFATHTQNNVNKGVMKRSTSGYTGVNFFKPISKWRARITVNKNTIELGYFDDIKDAIKARKEAENKYFGLWSYEKSMSMEVS